MADGTYVTRNLSLAAYLSEFGGLPLRKGGRTPGGDFEFVLEDPSGRGESLAVQWVNSCCRRFEDRVLALKTLLRSGGSGGGRG